MQDAARSTQLGYQPLDAAFFVPEKALKADLTQRTRRAQRKANDWGNSSSCKCGESNFTAEYAEGRRGKLK